jgi:putative sigma-54 modulation protein
MVEIRLSARNIELTDALRKYCNEKISKYDYLFDKAVGIAVELIASVAHRGTAQDFSVEINVEVPLARIRVSEKGKEIYAVIDKATDVLAERMKRYKGKLVQWEGEKSWKSVYLNNIEKSVDDLVEEVEDYTDYSPEISKKVTLEESAPMHEAEAIEHMELQGLTSFLFKNSETSSWCMVRKTPVGYELIATPA